MKIFNFSIWLLDALLIFCNNTAAQEFDWSSWWSYDGISGPGFWGVINRRWRLCSDGHRQSPVDLTLSSLVYDQTMPNLDASSNMIDGTFSNTGFGFQWTPDEKMDSKAPIAAPTLNGNHEDTKNDFFIKGGPLHYKYKLSHIVLRWSNTDQGSEHSLQGTFFPAEVQLYFYNVDLYKKFSAASDKPSGVAAVSVLLQVGQISNPVLKIWMDHLHLVPHRGKATDIPFVRIGELFTSTKFVTYDGSLTEPPCEETVTWIIMNKPAYITKNQLHQLQLIRKGAQGHSTPASGNVRPIQTLHHRSLRTNIYPYNKSCPKSNTTSMFKVREIMES